MSGEDNSGAERLDLLDLPNEVGVFRVMTVCAHSD